MIRACRLDKGGVGGILVKGLGGGEGLGALVGRGGGVADVRTAEGNPETTLGLSWKWEGSGGRRSRNSTCETTWHKKIQVLRQLGTSTYLGIQMLPQKIGVVELMVGDCLTSAPYCKRVDWAPTMAFHQHHLWSFQEVEATPCMHSCTACVFVGFVVVFVCAHVRLLFIGVVVRPRETIPGFATYQKPTPFRSARQQCSSLRRWKLHVFMP